MKPAAIYKIIDLVFQLFFICIGFILGLEEKGGGFDALEQTVIAYMWVGGAQVLSCIVNRLALGNARSKSRRVYEWTLIIVLVISAASFTGPLIVVWGLTLLCISPVMAVWYLIMTVAELAKAAKQNDVAITDENELL